MEQNNSVFVDERMDPFSYYKYEDGGGEGM